MKNIFTFHETPIRRAARILIASLASASVSIGQAAVTLGNQPPVVRSAPEPAPNIILTLDDSGSMAWNVNNNNTAPSGQSRMDYLKAAANQAFNAYNNGIFRLAYQSINGNSSSTYRALGFTTTQKRNLMKPFEGRHRTEFFTWLNDLDAEGSTPLRARTLGAGQYAMGYVSGSLLIGARDTYTYDNKTYRYDPLNGLDCRRSIHILLTDGEWNDSGITLPASYKVDDRPGNNETTTIDVPTPQAGTLGPNTPIVTYSGNIALDNSGHIYRDPTTLTLADLSFNYWATDLRSDLSNNIKAKLFKKGDETFTSGTVSKTVPEW